MTLTLLAVMAVAAYVALLVVTSGQSFDPALDLDSGRGDDAATDVGPDATETVPDPA